MIENKGDLILSENAISYTWLQLAQRVGITISPTDRTGFESLSIPVYYQIPNEKLRETPCLIVVPCSPGSPKDLVESSSGTVPTLPLSSALPEGQSLNIEDPVPILFFDNGEKDCEFQFARIENKALVIYVDIIMSTFFMLSRWEELLPVNRDLHDRFPSMESVAYKQRFLHRPIIDEYAMILRSWLRKLLPSWTPETREFEVILSHDIDNIKMFPNLLSGFRALGVNLIKKHNINQIKMIVNEMFSSLFAPTHQSKYRAIQSLAYISKKYGFSDTFYFMVSKNRRFDSDYKINSPYIQKIIRSLINQGFRIGLHPGYHTYKNKEIFKDEINRFTEVTGKNKLSIRQHFLRFSPDMWSLMNDLGVISDSSLGYADTEGFRAGTCHPYNPFDFDLDVALDLVEFPLIVMDATLKRYKSFSPQESANIIFIMAKRCREVEGTFTLLWHNSSFSEDQSAWGDIYINTVQRLHGLSKV